jgi:type IV fimbrial biogenesis protein FimT
MQLGFARSGMGPATSPGTGPLRRVRSEHGFSLVELLAVFAIIAAASTLAAPSVSRAIDNYRLKSAARQLMTDLQYARTSAVSRNADYTVTINSATNQYSISTGGVQEGPTRALSNPTNAYYMRGVSLGTTGNPVVITFSTLGRANPASTITVKLDDLPQRSVMINEGGSIQIN